MSNTERPGVYTTYQVSASYAGTAGGGAVGLAASAEGGTAGKVAAITSYAGAVSAFGGGNLCELAKLLLRNGAGVVYAAAVADGDYDTAFAALMGVSDVKFMVCDSQSAEIHAKLQSAIAGGDEAGKYRIGVVESGKSTAAELIALAESLNSERMVLVSHHETEGVPGAVAAAVCGVMAGESDPAVPLNGAALTGLGAIGANFSDGDVTLLVRGGVTPMETVGGGVSVVRGVTTRSRTGGVADATWREVNTVLIIDQVIPSIRDGLRAAFSRSKNTAQTRGAIRTEVMIRLESYVRAEIIDSYDAITVEPDGEDPSVCLVSFGFTVAHGLNKISLAASITV
ncbi:MAG: phage tail sheath C-terminal domain-containing protein [Oscillospiraceae bacterium]